ncbi:basic membrane protein A [Comamonas odontotermitis]|uniref:Basic membrane protein A n=1 Tax=Comamonas odontotermitis TaxID=379895 RepID=A0ABR6RDW2_9BURK|nr:BMP family ABC transporter substrate-binding protein [Comamonas odontotermitis]MBB6577319.1 basic membrane protein A [Comamonas odontotermitis]
MNFLARRPRVAVALFGPQGQGSFNEAGLQGVQRALAAGHDVTPLWIAPRDEAARTAAVEQLCAQGFDLIVAHGGQGDEPVARALQRWSGQRFAITQGSLQAPRVARYEVQQEQSAFLAGVLAALCSRSGVAAHFSGERVRPGLLGRAAYAHGLRAAGWQGRLLTQFCGHQHQPQLAELCIHTMADAGADVLFAMIDGGRSGVTAACRARGVAQIGNVLDWVARDPQVFVASAVADSGEAIFRAVTDFARGELALGERRRFGLEEPALVRLQLRGDLPASVRVQLDTWSHRLCTGETVPDNEYAGEEWPVPQEAVPV